MARWVMISTKETLSDGENPRVEQDWYVTGDTHVDNYQYSILTARLELLAVLPTSFANLPLTSIELARKGASGTFVAKVIYSMRVAPGDGKFDFTMDSRPEQRRMFMALSTVASYQPTGYTAANQNGFLKVNSDQQPDGTDVFVPTDTINVSVWWALSRFVGTQTANYQTLQAYVDLIETLLGKVNSSTFTFTARGLTFTYLAGECLFSSRRLSQQAADLWQVDMGFRIKRNFVEPTLTVWNGSDVTVKGWDEVDFQSRPAADNTAIALVPAAIGAQIKRKYFTADLNLLKVPAP